MDNYLTFDLTEDQQLEISNELSILIVKAIQAYITLKYPDGLPVDAVTSALVIAMAYGIMSIGSEEDKQEEVAMAISFLRAITETKTS